MYLKIFFDRWYDTEYDGEANESLRNTILNIAGLPTTDRLRAKVNYYEKDDDGNLYTTIDHKYYE